jgi:hypothetical protein
MTRPSLLAALVLVLATGCVPTLHFRALARSHEPLPPQCRLIDRCDYVHPATQSRCEMADLSVPELGALAECQEIVEG